MDVYDAFSMVTFVLVIYIMASMPTKKDIRRLARPEAEGRRQKGLRDLLRERVGTPCTLNLADAHAVVNELGGNVVELAGTVVDVDDDWVLMEALDKKGHRRLIAMRLDQVTGINE